MGSEKLAESIRQALGKYNDDTKPVVIIVQEIQNELTCIETHIEYLIESDVLEKILQQRVMRIIQCFNEVKRDGPILKGMHDADIETIENQSAEIEQLQAELEESKRKRGKNESDAKSKGLYSERGVDTSA